MNTNDRDVKQAISDKNKMIIDKFGLEACLEVTNYVTQRLGAAMKNHQAGVSATDLIEEIGKKFGATKSEALDMHIIGMEHKMSDLEESSSKAYEQYNANRHKLPNCPISGCGGKLHLGHSLSPEFDGKYFCDTCEKMFQKKKKQ